MKRKIKTKHRLFSLLIFIMLIVVSLLTLPFINRNENEEIIFTIESGESIKSMALRLKEEGIINDDKFFIILSKMFDVDTKIKSGDYLLMKNSYEYNTLMKMYRGEVLLIKITIPEGFNIFQIARRVEFVMGIDSTEFVNTCYNKALLKKYSIKGKNCEGYLFPDTYLLSKGKTAYQIIEMMLKRFKQVVYDELFKTNEYDFSDYDYIILASMIEKEAVVDREKAIISGVYYNRLRKKMYLQCCATVLYSLGKTHGIPTYEETQINSPYNTYKNLGLPPGPICSPGIKSIKAAISPEKNPYLFYVSKGDGTHIFTKSYKEHIRVQNNLR